jgi:hypothetical protein
MKKLLAVSAVLLTFNALIFDMPGVTAAIVRAIETCLYTIIPALFGFMLISSFLIKSGLHRLIFKPIFILFRNVLKLSEEQFGIFLLSLFGGYPVGAKLIADSRDEHSEPGSILPFCYCPSPGFAIAVAGSALFSNPRAGVAVYLSNALACVIVAVILTFRNKKTTGGHSRQPLKLSQSVFTSSVMSASSALFPVCVIVTMFGLIGGVLGFYGVNHPYILAALELTNVSGLSPEIAMLPLIAALFSFGGLCIIMQVPTLTKGKVPLKRFFLWRLPAAVISAGVCKVLTLTGFVGYESAVPALSESGNRLIKLDSGSPVASVALFIMAVILVQTAQEREV